MEVGINLFRCLNLIYKFICFSGLTWQVTQISTNFFEFQTVSSIDVSIPGSEEIKDVNICFEGHELMDYELYSGIRKKYFGIDDPLYRASYGYLSGEQKFQVILPIWEVFLSLHLGTKSHGLAFNASHEIFMLGNLICYNMKHDRTHQSKVVDNFYPISDTIIAYGYMETHKMENVSEILAVLGPKYKLPWIEFYLSKKHKIGKRVSNIIKISGYSFHVSKLEYPYTDNCFNYTSMDVVDRDDLINNCINDVMNSEKNVSWTMKIFRKGSPYRLGSQHFDIVRHCSLKYKQTDCYQETVFTESVIKQSWDDGRLSVSFEYFMTDKPSYFLSSQPKIQNIDFITYVFGAFGTWFGLSFIGINPFGSLIKPKSMNTKVEPVQNIGNTLVDEEIKSLIIDSVLDETNEFKSLVVSLKKSINGLEYDMHRVKRVLKQVNEK